MADRTTVEQFDTATPFIFPGCPGASSWIVVFCRHPRRRERSSERGASEDHAGSSRGDRKSDLRSRNGYSMPRRSRSRGRRRDGRSRSRDRRRDRSRSERRRADESRRAREEQRKKSEHERRLREEEEKMKKELDEARRDDLTVLVMNLSLKATERDVWKLFSEKCGKVRDIQIIRDARSGKSKGVGYVEFYTPTSVMTSLAMTGQLLMDQPVIIQASQAEKNRAAKAAKQQQAELTEHGPMKIYVGGLIENLAALDENDLKQLFSPFGDIVNVDLHKDPYTGRSKGYAFIHFRNAQDAREAMTAMNGFDIGGRAIKVNSPLVVHCPLPNMSHCLITTFVDFDFQVGYATENLQRPAIVTDNPYQTALQFAEAANDTERLDDEGGGLLSGVNPRISLMQKLQRAEGPTTSMPTVQPGGLLAGMVLPVPSAPSGRQQLLSESCSIHFSVSPISCNVCLEPLFTAEDVVKEGASLLDDIEEDVKNECSKFGLVLKVFVNRKLLDRKVYVKFSSSEAAVKASTGMQGRYFAGKPIQCSYVPDQIWNAVCQSSY
ncbi:RNA-binding protein 39-like [Condylostylus longicornis]|uniref:RNA-binding protein 39-like n=1 Tax=Condylostylus longicornis TaxID=2530218 RepID=UPI00244E46F4|nr:RNA-binding protein 39-like [Condylostylus longicornis]